MRKLVVLPAAGFLVLAGCGGTSHKTTPSGGATSPSGPSPTSTAPARGGAAQRLAVGETEYKLSPATPTVAGGTVQVTATNNGTIVHALEIEGAGPGGKDIRTADIQPGASATLTASLRPGKYVWYCPIDGHRGLGIKGTITVRAASQGGSSATPAPATGGTSGGSSGGGRGY